MLKGQNRCSRERVIEDRSSPPIPIQQVAQTVWMISGANPPRDIGVVRLCDLLWSFSRVFSGAGRYMRAAEKHLDSLCKGQFP